MQAPHHLPVGARRGIADRKAIERALGPLPNDPGREDDDPEPATPTEPIVTPEAMWLEYERELRRRRMERDPGREERFADAGRRPTVQKNTDDDGCGYPRVMG